MSLRITHSAKRFARLVTQPVLVSRAAHFRQFHTTQQLYVVKPFPLADIGEGITECQLIQWFVQPGARVEQFDKLCEVQSDKASVEITSPFDGVIKKLHYEPDDMAITGKPLVDIDIQGEISEADVEKLGGTTAGGDDSRGDVTAPESAKTQQELSTEDEGARKVKESSEEQSQQHQPREGGGSMGSLATPAVRHLTKELNVRIEEVVGTGKQGRVLKQDIHRHVQERDQTSTTRSSRSEPVKEDRKVPLSPVQNQMFKTMTRSLNIPHFLYTCSADMSSITALRKKLNASRTAVKVTSLAFILKAVSVAFHKNQLLNTALDLSDAKKPSLVYRASHNFGVAIDTPSGLLVPTIRDVQNLSIDQVAARLGDISDRARRNKLAPSDFNGATFTISNIGSIGGGVVSPVISEPQVAILGVGRSKVVPAFDEAGELVKREELVFSWSADHRVVDGAECARCAESVKGFLEDPGSMLVELR